MLTLGLSISTVNRTEENVDAFQITNFQFFAYREIHTYLPEEIENEDGTTMANHVSLTTLTCFFEVESSYPQQYQTLQAMPIES